MENNLLACMYWFGFYRCDKDQDEKELGKVLICLSLTHHSPLLRVKGAKTEGTTRRQALKHIP